MPDPMEGAAAVPAAVPVVVPAADAAPPAAELGYATPGDLLAGRAAWLRVMKWPKLLSTVLLVAMFVCLVRLLAAAMRDVARERAHSAG